MRTIDARNHGRSTTPIFEGIQDSVTRHNITNCSIEIVGHESNIPANTCFIWIKDKRYGRAELGSFVIK